MSRIGLLYVVFVLLIGAARWPAGGGFSLSTFRKR